MNRIIIAAVAASGSLTLASGASAAPSISIAQPGGLVVGGLHLVAYPGAGKIAGAVTGAPAGTRVALERLAFPFSDSYRAVATAVTSAGGRYVFSVRPTVGTRYRAVSGGVTSKAVAYYVANSGKVISAPSCAGMSVCHATAVWDESYPPSVASALAAKHIYFYDATRVGSLRAARLNLDPQAVTSVRKITSSRYLVTASWTMAFPVASNFNYTWCTRDTYAQDGFGLPTAAGCGGASVPNTNAYIG